MEATPVVEFVNVSKTFGAFRAVKQISFTVGKGEFFSLLGRPAAGRRPRSA